MDAFGASATSSSFAEVALAQQVQIEQLLRVLQAQAAELGALKGNDQELQQKLALVEQLAREAQKG